MKEAEIINKIAEILGQSGSVAIQHYAIWHIASAIGFVMAGLFLIYKGYKFVTPKEWDELLTPIVKGVLIMVGGLMLLSNVPDLFSPEAISIHQLLKDIKG